MPTSLIIVDDFLEAPEGMREQALKLSYPDLKGAFPGRNSAQRLLLEGLTEHVSALTGEKLKPIEPLHSHGKCRLTLARDGAEASVHIDPGFWSGILYLTLPEHCQGGTQFFRHLPTGTDQAPIHRDELEAMGYANLAEMRAGIVDVDGDDPSKWEQLMEVPMRFNRLLLLRPWLWHTAGPGFGDRIENGRLIHVMFFVPRGP